MDIVEALTRVVGLARRSIRDSPSRHLEIEGYSLEERIDEEACRIVEDYIVNQLGDD